jgi:hypothetical protein
MMGKMSAVLASAASAFLVVTVISGFAPSVAAHAAQSPATAPGRAQDAITVTAFARPACRESWPYYEPTCLHDARQPDGRARVVRVVSIERSVAGTSPLQPR